MKIRTRLTIQFIIIVAIILVISFSITYFFSAKYRENHFFEALRKRANTTEQLLTKINEVDFSIMKIIDANKKDFLTSENITVYDKSNKQIYTNNDSCNFDTSNGLLNEIRTKGELKWQQGDFNIVGISYGDKNNGIVITAGAIDSFGKNQSRNLLIVMLSSFVFVICVVGISGWIYAGAALKPIIKIIEQAEDISATNLGLRLDEGNKKDEIALLSAKFNNMLGRLEASFTLQKTFVANASHELKNPLTVITSQLEVSLLRERTLEEYQKTITSVLEDIKGLNTVSLGLLDLARLNSDEIEVDFLPTRIDELLWQSKDELIHRNPDYKISFAMKLPEEENKLLVLGNEYLLKTAFLNLMDNACKFSNNKEVNIALEIIEGKITISFNDNGIGITEKDLPNIFEPFYRSASVVSISGHGIGLSLVEKIIQLHHANISVTSKAGEGSSFVIAISSGILT